MQANIPLQGAGKSFLLSVGRLSKQKAHWSLIKAFSLIAKKNTDLILVILGEGILKAQLMLLVNELSLTDRVVFKGFDNNPYRYMKNCELFILPSLNEGFPLVLLEALASGAPVLSSDCVSGPREIISPSSSLKSEVNYEKEFEFGYLYSNIGCEMNFDANFISDADKSLASAIDNILLNKSKLNGLREKGGCRLEPLSLQAIYKEWKMILTK